MTNPDETADPAAGSKPEVSGEAKTDEAKKADPEAKSESEDMSIGSPAKIPALEPSTNAVKEDTNTEGASAAADPGKSEENLVEFKVVFNKKKYEICFGNCLL